MAKEPVYIKNTLGRDEEVKWVADLHWFVWLAPALWGLIGLILCFAPNPTLGLIILAICGIVVLGWLKTEYVVTNKRVIAKRGIIAVKTEELRNGKVESVYITQGIIERCFGCGTVVFGGTGGSKVKFKFIANPRQVKTHLEEIIEENK